MNETPGPGGEPKPLPSANPTKPAIAVLSIAVVGLCVATIVLWSRIAPPGDERARIEAIEQRLGQPGVDVLGRLDDFEQQMALLAAAQARLNALESQAAPATDPALRQRIEALEQRRINDPSGQPARVEALERKVASDTATLTARLETAEAASIRDLSAALARIGELERKALDVQRALLVRIETLERRPGADLTAIQEHLTRLDQRPLPDPRAPERLDALTSRLDGQAGQTAALDARLAKIEATTDKIGRLAYRAEKLGRIRQAEEALASGLKLGALPDAPPALARFADTPPPTEVKLRLAFPELERAVRAASRSDSTAATWSDRIWERMQGLVTIRQGDRVLIGDSALGVLARAQVALEAGDLTGAVAALSGLTGEAAGAAAPWLADARALLEARAALAVLAARD